MPRTPRIGAPLLAAAGALAVAASCSREPRSRPYSEIEAEQHARLAAAEAAQRDAEAALNPPSDATVPDLDSMPPDARDAETRRRLALLEQAMNSSQVSLDDPSGTSPTQPIDWNSGAPHHAGDPEPALDGAHATIEPTPTAPIPATIIADAPANSTVSPDERLQRAADPLVSALRTDLVTTDTPLEVLLQLGALEAVSADALPASTYSGDAPVRTLTTQERTLIEAWRELHAGARDEGATGDVSAVARALTNAAERVRSLSPLSIATAALCTKVERYGVYDELTTFSDGTHKMVAGKPHRVLLYLELENFSDRPDTQGAASGWTVDLTVGLKLHHLGRDTDLLAWRMPDEAVRVFSRNHRREFFLSIVADLPPNISVDSYALKATVKDENSSAIAERVLRIDMVADESALISLAD